MAHWCREKKKKEKNKKKKEKKNDLIQIDEH